MKKNLLIVLYVLFQTQFVFAQTPPASPVIEQNGTLALTDAAKAEIATLYAAQMKPFEQMSFEYFKKSLGPDANAVSDPNSDLLNYATNPDRTLKILVATIPVNGRKVTVPQITLDVLKKLLQKPGAIGENIKVFLITLIQYHPAFYYYRGDVPGNKSFEYVVEKGVYPLLNLFRYLVEILHEANSTSVEKETFKNFFNFFITGLSANVSGFAEYAIFYDNKVNFLFLNDTFNNLIAKENKAEKYKYLTSEYVRGDADDAMPWDFYTPQKTIKLIKLIKDGDFLLNGVSYAEGQPLVVDTIKDPYLKTLATDMKAKQPLFDICVTVEAKGEQALEDSFKKKLADEKLTFEKIAEQGVEEIKKLLGEQNAMQGLDISKMFADAKNTTFTAPKLDAEEIAFLKAKFNVDVTEEITFEAPNPPVLPEIPLTLDSLAAVIAQAKPKSGNAATIKAMVDKLEDDTPLDQMDTDTKTKVTSIGQKVISAILVKDFAPLFSQFVGFMFNPASVIDPDTKNAFMGLESVLKLKDPETASTAKPEAQENNVQKNLSAFDSAAPFLQKNKAIFEKMFWNLLSLYQESMRIRYVGDAVRFEDAAQDKKNAFMKAFTWNLASAAKNIKISELMNRAKIPNADIVKAGINPDVPVLSLFGGSEGLTVIVREFMKRVLFPNNPAVKLFEPGTIKVLLPLELSMLMPATSPEVATTYENLGKSFVVDGLKNNAFLAKLEAANSISEVVLAPSDFPHMVAMYDIVNGLDTQTTPVEFDLFNQKLKFDYKTFIAAYLAQKLGQLGFTEADGLKVDASTPAGLSIRDSQAFKTKLKGYIVSILKARYHVKNPTEAIITAMHNDYADSWKRVESGILSWFGGTSLHTDEDIEKERANILPLLPGEKQYKLIAGEFVGSTDLEKVFKERKYATVTPDVNHAAKTLLQEELTKLYTIASNLSNAQMSGTITGLGKGMKPYTQLAVAENKATSAGWVMVSAIVNNGATDDIAAANRCADRMIEKAEHKAIIDRSRDLYGVIMLRRTDKKVEEGNESNVLESRSKYYCAMVGLNTK